MMITSIFMNNRTQAVRLPSVYRFSEQTQKVFVRQVGVERVISPVDQVWDSFFDNPAFSVAYIKWLISFLLLYYFTFTLFFCPFPLNSALYAFFFAFGTRTTACLLMPFSACLPTIFSFLPFTVMLLSLLSP